MAYYAWSEIHHALENGPVVIQRGQEVSKDDFTDEDWKHLRNEGVISDKPYPDDIHPSESVKTYNLRKANEAYAQAQGSVRRNESFDNTGTEGSGTVNKQPWEQ